MSLRFSILILGIVWRVKMWAVKMEKTEFTYRKCIQVTAESINALCDHYYPLAVYFNVLTPTQCGTLCGKYNYKKENPVMTNEEVNSALKFINATSELTSFYTPFDIPIFMHENST